MLTMDWRDELSDLALLEDDLDEDEEDFISMIFDNMFSDPTWFASKDEIDKIDQLWTEYCT